MEFTRISNLEIALGILALVSYFYLGFSVYLRDPKSWTNRLFIIFAFVLGAYTIVNPFSLHPVPPTPESQLFWIRMVIFVASFIGPILFLLVHTFSQKEITLRKKYLFLIFAVILANALASLTPLIFESIAYPQGEPVPKVGRGFLIFVLNFPVMVSLSFGLLVRKHFRAVKEEKTKLFYFLIGIVATFSLMVFLTVVSVAIFKTPIGVFLGPITPVILVSFIAYAIVKHKFLDIQPIIARAVSFLFALILFAAIYAALIVLAVRQFIPIPLNTSALILLFALMLAGILSFQPLERGMRKITDKFFFKGEYDKDELLAHLTRIMAETIDLGELAQKILQVLTAEMKISKGAFLVVDHHSIIAVEEVGFSGSRLQTPELERLYHKDSGSISSFIFEELEEGEIKNVFRRLDIALAVPVRVEKIEVAVLVFGPKRTGERYHSRDIEFLQVLAAEVGIAIQNAKSFSEIKKFSKELEKRVDERTAELQETQERELAKAKEVVRLKDEFVFLAAHELRTPVTAIRGFLELTEESQKKFPRDIQNNLTAIAQASEHLNQLINDLLEIARSEGGVTIVNVGPCQFEPILREVLEETVALIRQKNIVVKIDIKPLPPVLCDPAKLKEALLNLLGNAIKYNKDGGIIDISVWRHPEEPRFIFEIRDTGYGIPKDRQAHIFQKFFRAGTKGTGDVLGTGLGLFITRMLIEKMGGAITFSSVEQEGSTFAFTLPLAEEGTHATRAKS